MSLNLQYAARFIADKFINSVLR